MSTHATVTFEVPALDCPQELRLIEAGFKGVDGLGSMQADYLRRRLQLEFDPRLVDERQLVDRLNAMGFPAQSVAPLKQITATRQPRRYDTLAAAMLLGAAAAAWWQEAAVLADRLAIATAAIGSISVARAAWRALRLRQVDVNALVILAAAGAIVTGDSFEAATAMVLFGIALGLESASVERTRRAVQSLIELTPPTAERLVDDRTETVEVDRLQVGDHVMVRPGQRVPADGVVVRGAGAVNEAPLSGESMPREKQADDPIWAGSLNGESALEVLVTRRAADSTLAHVARLVESAQVTRAETVRLVDRLARWYTPTVVALAILLVALLPWVAGLSWHDALHRGLVLLVIACPCALVISTPLTIVCGLYTAARRGVLIKGGEHLEQVARLDALALDKTGTLTTGRMQVVDLRPVDGRSADEVLQRAASLEHHSEHPIARAIVAAAVDRNLALERVEQFSAERGIGVRGQVAGQWFAVCGSTSAANESSAPAGDLWRSHPPWREMTQSSSHTLAAVVGPDGLWGVIALADQPRPEAAAVVAELQRLGIARVAMLTGDRRAVADDIARQVGIDEVHAELLPADKLAIVGQLKQQATVVAVVGDGVNDAPALAAAGLGIALGTEASDTALETADVVILRSDLRRLLDLMHIGLACRQRLIENIALALGAKLITLGLAAAGLATLWMAVAADVGATLAVVFNGMRLLGSTPRRRPMR